MSRMKAFVKYGEQPCEGSIQEVEPPRAGPGEVVIKVAACGICGSDLHAYRAEPGYEWVRPPVILGHEFTGTVASVGPAVERFKPGDRVVTIGIEGCLDCALCRDGRTNLCARRRVVGLNHNGGMAEFAAIDEAYLIEVPEALDLTLAALTEPLSVAIHAVEKAGLRPGKRVIVTGPGPIGMMCAALGRAFGADVLLAGTEADERTRLPVARELGIGTINVEREQSGTSLKYPPPDIWVEASGSTAALNLAIDLMPRGGEIVVVAMYSKGVNWSPTVSVRAEHTYHFSYASSFRDYKYALDLLQSGRLGLENLIARYPLDKAREAFEAAGKGAVVKPVLLP